MFTGIVQQLLQVVQVTGDQSLRQLTLAHRWPDVRAGESVAINGACLTVAGCDAQTIVFDVIRETLDRTNLGLLKAGDLVHVERSLRVGDRFDGHFVQGHVDGTVGLLGIHRSGADVRLRIDLPDRFAQYVVPKGSICLDGASLTVAAVTPGSFEVALIPTTLQLTLLGQRPIGWPFNVEFDMIAKTVVRFLELRNR